ncbi:MAG TPA: hypothetical protein VEI02_15180 [Planctomycetota bacterium]|nr:hypothetical protein [Planctomycetota bacterium]
MVLAPLSRRLALALALAATVGDAQFCTPDDGFTGPCCAPVAGALPVFPAMTLPGLGASLLECGVDASWPTTVSITPIPVLCDYWLFDLAILGASPFDPSIPTSLFFGKYARTWMETTPLGAVQVWRFLVNGEVAYAPAAPVFPPPYSKYPFNALPPFTLPTHFQGHVDYSRHCLSGVWEAAMALTHLCPFEAHAAFSAYPLAIPPGVPSRTYHFVAPDNFAFGPGPSPEGPILGDAQRSSLLVPGVSYACLAENPIVGGALTTSYCDCACAGPAGPATYHHQTLTATIAGCGAATAMTLLPLPGFLPTGLRVHMFGSWTAVPGAQLYPGTKHVGHYMGVAVMTDLCPGTSAPFGPIHAVTGVGTAGGHPQTIAVGLPATTESADLCNMLVFPALTPGLGGYFAADRVWSFNLM